MENFRKEHNIPNDGNFNLNKFLCGGYN